MGRGERGEGGGGVAGRRGGEGGGIGKGSICPHSQKAKKSPLKNTRNTYFERLGVFGTKWYDYLS